MPKPKPIPAKLLKADIATPSSDVHHVRIVVSMNNVVTLIRVRVEGELIPKWTQVSGFLVWETKQQPVQGTLDVDAEVWGGPNGLFSMAVVCDEKQVGKIDLNTMQSPATASESYHV